LADNESRESEFVATSIAVVRSIERAGVVATPTGAFWSIRHGGEQIGIFALTTDGEFRWGWVATPKGRTDRHVLAEYTDAIARFVESQAGRA
jgi:hypothetical protein